MCTMILRPVLLSAGAVATLVVAGCVADDTGQPATTISQSPSSAAGEPGPAAYTAAACPSPLVEGRPELDLGPEFECGYLTVAEDRSTPDGRTIRLAVARAPATSPTPRPDPIVYLVGGPGNSGLLSAPGLLTAGWNTDRDVIVIEQRGTLKAEPLLSCPELDAHLDIAVALAPTGPDAMAGESAAVTACRDRLVAEGWDLAAYDSTQNAADVADLRVAMGIDEWNVYGVSYGTDLALQTLRPPRSPSSSYPASSSQLPDHLNGATQPRHAVLMSERTAKAVVEEMFRRQHAGDDTVLDDLVAEDMVNHAAGPQGRDGLKLILSIVDNDLGPVTAEQHHLIGEGDLVAQHLTVRGTHRASTMPLLAGTPVSGRPATWTFIHIWRVVGGKIVEHWACRDDMGLLEQLRG